MRNKEQQIEEESLKLTQKSNAVSNINKTRLLN